MLILRIIFSIVFIAVPPAAPESLQEHRHHLVRIPGKGILAATQAPVVHKSPLEHGVAVHNLVHRQVCPQLPVLLPFLYYLPQKLKVGAVPVQQAFLAPGCELR